METRSHFAAWAIVSSPLTLAMDVNNDTVMDAVWDIIANKAWKWDIELYNLRLHSTCWLLIASFV